MNDSLLNDVDTEDHQIDESKEYFKDLVGEGRKFKTPEDLARGKFLADKYVETLTKRQDDLRAAYTAEREENAKRARLEELIDKLSGIKPENNNTTIPPVNNEVNRPSFDPNEIESLIDKRMQAREVGRREQENFNFIKDKLVEKFGSNYSSTIKEQINDLGITEDEFNLMARKQPKVLAKTLGLDTPLQRESFQAPPRSNQRNDTFSNRAPKRTWAYYQDMKKQNPKAYFDPKIAVQMHNDALALGEAFKDGDFNN